MKLIIAILFFFFLISSICTINETQVSIWISSEDMNNRLTQKPGLTFESDNGESADYEILVDSSKTYQSILGMGASFESSTCYNLKLCSNRSEVIESLVSQNSGIGMNLVRICIGTSDFTGEDWYSYDDMPLGQTDEELSNFSIAKDEEYVIPTIQIALEKNPNLLIFASSWSPPAWMKTSKRLCGGELKQEYYEVYARYLLKFVEAYESIGIHIYAITVQNEPGVNTKDYPSCYWSANNEKIFVRDYLGPIFKNKRTKIWIFDHNFDNYNFPDQILSDSDAARYVDGTAFHHYGGSPDAMTKIHNSYLDKDVYFTEGSVFGADGAIKCISYFRNWARSYNAWVTMIDENGEPNNGPFKCDPTVIVLKSGTTEYRYDYYIYGQFMKFVDRKAVRIFSSEGTRNLSNVAFENPDASIVVIVANSNDSPQKIKIVWNGNCIESNLPQKSVSTYKWHP